MFAGKWMFHLLDAGHYILIGMAWLPLFLLLLEAAIRRGCLVRATAAGAVFALIALSTHPQWTFYAALFAAAWTLADGPGVGRAGRLTVGMLAALGRWAGLGLWAAVIAGALSAGALLPTMEAAGQASRGPGVPPDEFVGEYNEIVHQLVGPSPVVGHRWEHRAGLGVLWLAAALWRRCCAAAASAGGRAYASLCGRWRSAAARCFKNIAGSVSARSSCTFGC